MKGFPLGKRVKDKWFSHLGTGKVVKTLKTRIHIQFKHRRLVYDRAHTQFLEKLK